MTYNQLPKAQGLYRPEFEHDACGIGLYAHLKGLPTHDIVKKDCKCFANWTTGAVRAVTRIPETGQAS